MAALFFWLNHPSGTSATGASTGSISPAVGLPDEFLDYVNKLNRIAAGKVILAPLAVELRVGSLLAAKAVLEARIRISDHCPDRCFHFAHSLLYQTCSGV